MAMDEQEHEQHQKTIKYFLGIVFMPWLVGLPFAISLGFFLMFALFTYAFAAMLFFGGPGGWWFRIVSLCLGAPLMGYLALLALCPMVYFGRFMLYGRVEHWATGTLLFKTGPATEDFPSIQEIWQDAKDDADDVGDVKRPWSAFDRLYWIYVWVATALCVYFAYCVVCNVPFFGLDIPALKAAIAEQMREWIDNGE